MKNEKRTLSVETVYSYLKWLSESSILYQCRCYGIHGKSVLKTQEKDFLPDISIESARETDNLMDIEDHNHKYVVCKEALAIGNDNGIEIVYIADFLLQNAWQ